MLEYYSLLKEIEKKTPMYTGGHSLNCLSAFLFGYEMAHCKNDTPEPPNQDFIPFHDWIAHKFGFRSSTVGWVNMINAVTLGLNPTKVTWEEFDLGMTRVQHDDARKRFYSLLEEYKIEMESMV